VVSVENNVGGEVSRPGAEELVEVYAGWSRKRLVFLLSMSLGVAVVSVLALCVGAVDVPLADTVSVLFRGLMPGLIAEPSNPHYATIITEMRAPRIVLTVLTGVSLGIAGMVMQGLLRNPLVSPFTLGVSTASSFGAAMSIVFGTALFGTAYYTSFSILGMTFSFSSFSTVMMSFVFGLCSIAIVLFLTRDSNVSRSTVILSGVIISYIFQAGIMFAKYASDDDQLREIALWMMGGLSNVTWSTIVIVLPVVLVCGIYLEKLSSDINVLSSGDDVARNLGIDVRKLRNRGLVFSTLITTVCIAFTGIIGFIGLMAPHICRMLIGNDSRYLLPASALMGAAILLISDTFSRVVMRPEELPVGIIMYIIGGIFFIWLVCGKKLGDRA
jgi:iron complex transport system permease protein